MSTFAEPGSPGAAQPRGDGWRPVSPGVVVKAYLANGWREVTVADVNDDTHEIRVKWPPPTEHDTGSEAPHTVLDASHYEPPESGLPAPQQ